MTNPKVLILMATFNGEKWITEQMNSIINQCGVDITILVSDDFSSDQTVNILKKKYVDHVEFLNNETNFGSAGKNFMNLYQHANANEYDYVALSDQDDIWKDNKLIKSINSINDNDVDFCSSYVEAFWQNGKKSVLKQNTQITDYDFIFEGAGQGCTFVMKQDFFKKFTLFFKENFISKNTNFYYHDWLIYIYARMSKHSWHHIKEPLMHYRQHNNNDTGAKVSLSGIAARIKKIKNGWYKKQIAEALKISFLADNKFKKLDNLKKFEKVFSSKNSLLRKLKLIFYLLKNGRRSFQDRTALLFAAIMGWI